MDILDKAGVKLEKGDIFKCQVWDSDDNHMWTFKYLLLEQEVLIYLGGGLDGGSAVGKRVSLDEFISDCQDTEDCCGPDQTQIERLFKI